MWLLALFPIGVSASLLAERDLTTVGFHRSLRTAALVLAIALAVMAYLHWRASGHAIALLVSSAGWALVGMMGIDRWQAVAEGPAAVGHLRFGLSVGAATWIGRAVLGPDVDSSLTARGELVRLGAVVVAATGAALVASALGVDRIALWLLVALVWASAGTAGVVRALRRARNPAGWISWFAVALALSEGARLVDATGGTLWVLAGDVARLAGLSMATLGSVHALAQVAISRRGVLHGMEMDGWESQARSDVERRERRHALSNALVLVEGATLTLERYQHRLSDEDRRDLQRALYKGIADLRALVVDPPDTANEPFDLGDVVTSAVVLARARGLVVSTDGDLTLQAIGRAGVAAAVIEALLSNAARHGGGDAGGPVTVEVESANGRAIVRVTDSGPGVPAGHREAIFDRGYRLRDDGPGQGMGLHTARTLIRQQGGYLRYEDRPGTGACFVISLPLVPRLGPGAVTPPMDEVEDRRQPVEQH